MKATQQQKGVNPDPANYELAAVQFTPGTTRYHYWVPLNWQVKPGDKLDVLVPRRQMTPERKTVTVVEVLLGSHGEHKVAYGQRAQIEPKIYYTDAMYTLETEAHFVPFGPSGTGPDQSNLPRKSTMKIHTITLLDNLDVTKYTEDQLIEKIIIAEAQMKRLKAIDHKPEKLVKQLEELEATINQLVEIIDGTP